MNTLCLFYQIQDVKRQKRNENTNQKKRKTFLFSLFLFFHSFFLLSRMLFLLPLESFLSRISLANLLLFSLLFFLSPTNPFLLLLMAIYNLTWGLEAWLIVGMGTVNGERACGWWGMACVCRAGRRVRSQAAGHECWRSVLAVRQYGEHTWAHTGAELACL